MESLSGRNCFEMTAGQVEYTDTHIINHKTIILKSEIQMLETITVISDQENPHLIN